MKKILTLCLCALSLLVAAAEKLGPFTVTPKGAVIIEDLQFALTCAGKDWKNWYPQTGKFFLPDDDMPQQTDGCLELSGKLAVGDAFFRFRETVRETDKNTIQLEYNLSSESGVETKEIALSTDLFHRDFTREGIAINGKTHSFKGEYDKTKSRVFTGLHDTENIIQLPLKRGILTIRGHFSLILQDNRKYRPHNRWALRLRPAVAAGLVRETTLRLEMEYKPYIFRTVSLKESANIDFKDDVAGDGKGGWTDQGENDMREFPRNQGTYAGVKYDIVNPETNGGKALLGFWHRMQTPRYPRTATVKANGAHGSWLYLLHALGWEPKKQNTVGTVTVHYADGSNETLKVTSGVDVANFWHPRQLKNGSAAWRGQTDLQVIGIYNTAYPVQDKPVDHLTFETTGNGGIWLVAGVTFADHRVPVAEKEPVVLTAGKEWRVIPYHPAVKGSIVDFSDQLDAPAGKYGFVKAAGNNFEFEKRPGVPVRFNGGNIALNVNFMNREDTDLLADQMAKVGYNFVRLHHFDNGLVRKDAASSTSLNPVMIDRLDYLVSAMKKRGIYITLDLFMSRELVKGEIPDFPDVKFGLNFKLAPYVSESAMQNWMTFSRNLMTHVNPYTGTAWKDESAIVTISLINENNIFKVASDPVLGPVYRKKFAEHVKTKGIRLTKENREREWMLFLMETYGKSYRRMAKFLKDEIGVKALLTDQNHLSNIPRTFMRNDFDLVDQHLYWEHPRFLIPGRAAEPFSTGNISLTSAYGSGTFLDRILGKPFTITELDVPYPSEYAAEGALFMGAYGSFQEWGGFCRFAISHTPKRITGAPMRINCFDAWKTPMAELADRMISPLFVRGDVKPSQTTYAFLLPENYLKEGSPRLDPPPFLARLGLLGKFGPQILPENGTANLPADLKAGATLGTNLPKASVPTVPADGTAKAFFTEMLRKDLIPAANLDLEKELYTSDTSELTLNHKEKSLRVVTPRTEGFFLQRNQSGNGAFASVKNNAGHAVFFFTARDNQPLSTSRRILFMHLTDCKNNGARFSSDDFTICENKGQTPILVRRGDASVTLHIPGDVKIYACRMDGKHIREVPFTRHGEKISFQAKTFVGKEPVLVYEITKGN